MKENQIDVRILIVKMLASGQTQKEVSEELDKLGISPRSLSYIEKLLKQMRKDYRAKTVIHLFVKLTKRGIV